MRCKIGNYFPIRYGLFGYENPDNFINAAYHTDLLNEIQKEIMRSRKTLFVKNFRNNYIDGKIPMYALTELFSFGTLSKFYKNMKNQDKKAIAQTYEIGYSYLESWIEHIAFVRNVCAHYGRLYNINLAKTPALYKQYNKAGVSNIRVFATLLCLKYLLPNDRHWYEFVDTIELLFEKYPNVKSKLMGFPTYWKSFLLE